MLSWLDHLLRRRTPLDVAEAYERWAPTYSPRAHNPLMELEGRAVEAMLPDVRGCAALDLACGSGRYIKILSHRGARPVVGLDASAPMLARAREITSNLVRADLLSLGLRPRSFHLITIGLALGHVQDLGRAMLEISRILAPGGAVVYSDLHPLGSFLGWERSFRAANGTKYEVRHHTHLFSDHVAACTAAGLSIEEVREPRIDFKSKWSGYPALLVIRARKSG